MNFSRTTIAAAVGALLPFAAAAQSNVTVYGVLDAAYVSASASGGQKASRLDSGGLNGSRLGFRGTEDLGGGYSARFVIETALSADGNTVAGGNNITNTRQSFVALVTPYGAVIGGRAQNAGYAISTKYDVMGGESIFSPVAQLTDNANLVVSGRDPQNRSDNSLLYSATFGGLSVAGGLSFGEQIVGATHAVGALGTIKDAQLGKSVRATYDQGPFSVGGAYIVISDVLSTGQNQRAFDHTEWILGGSYDFGMVKLVGSYQKAKNEGAGTALMAAATGSAVNFEDKVWNLGASIKVGGNGVVKLAHARLKDTRVAAREAKSWGVQYEHALSKRSTAYLGYTSIDNNANATYSLLNTGVVPTADGKASQFGMGFNHSF